MKNLIAFVLIIFSFSSLAGIDPESAYKEALAGKAVFIDVREEEEIKLGMIKNAQWFPLSRMKGDSSWKKDFDSLTTNKNIYLYCRSGNRSGQAKEILKALATDSTNLGGYSDLRKVLPSTK